MINDVFRAMILQAERFRQTEMESQYKEQIILAEKYAVIGTVFSSADSEAPAGLAAVYPLDLSSERSIADGAESVARAGRKIDILINNAGATAKQGATDWEKIIKVNLTGTNLCCQAGCFTVDGKYERESVE